jgi:hypothetical protein
MKTPDAGRSDRPAPIARKRLTALGSTPEEREAEAAREKPRAWRKFVKPKRRKAKDSD